MNYFESNWCDLLWSSWVSFEDRKFDWRMLPVERGLYRVRPKNVDLLVYVGETGRGLRDRLNALRRGIISELMPYNDPHTAAPNLWAWRQEEHWSYECSASIFGGSTSERKALECLLLWKYRLEKGESTLCNHGRFHKNYVKSSDRSKGRRGFRLPISEIKSLGGPNHPPLQLQGYPIDSDWMGLSWSKSVCLDNQVVGEIPSTSGLYKIISPDQATIIYIGESKRLRERFAQHCNSFKNTKLQFSYVILPEKTEKYQLHELENDLIGAYYNQTSSIPEFQFSPNRSKDALNSLN
jgi:hypothetical protein